MGRQEINTQYTEFSKDKRDTIFIEEAAKKAAEASGDPEIAEELGRSLREVVETNEEVKKDISSPSGEYFKIEIRKNPKGTYEIVTRRRTEEYLSHAELEKKLRETQMKGFLGSHVAELAHEIKNSLTVVIGRCDLLSSQFNIDPSILEHLTEIKKVAIRTNKVCDSYITLYKIQEDNMTLTCVSKSIDKVVTLLEPIYRAKGVEIEKHYDENLPQVCASDNMLYSLWLNLIKNAYEAIKSIEKNQGKIIVSVEPYYGKIPDFSIHVSIEDNGCGMDEETLKAWKSQNQAFFTKKQDGYGIGRHIIFEVIRKHKLGYSVESRLGEGTKFSVYFQKPQ